MSYNNLDLAIIIGNCNSLQQLADACKVMRWLYFEGESINMDFALLMANKRQQTLIKNINKNHG